VTCHFLIDIVDGIDAGSTKAGGLHVGISAGSNTGRIRGSAGPNEIEASARKIPSIAALQTIANQSASVTMTAILIVWRWPDVTFRGMERHVVQRRDDIDGHRGRGHHQFLSPGMASSSQAVMRDQVPGGLSTRASEYSSQC
jgi:hypothetical protein